MNIETLPSHWYRGAGRILIVISGLILFHTHQYTFGGNTSVPYYVFSQASYRDFVRIPVYAMGGNDGSWRALVPDVKQCFHVLIWWVCNNKKSLSALELDLCYLPWHDGARSLGLLSGVDWSQWEVHHTDVDALSRQGPNHPRAILGAHLEFLCHDTSEIAYRLGHQQWTRGLAGVSRSCHDWRKKNIDNWAGGTEEGS